MSLSISASLSEYYHYQQASNTQELLRPFESLIDYRTMDPIEQILWSWSELIKLTSNEASIFQILSGIFHYERCSTQLVWVFSSDGLNYVQSSMFDFLRPKIGGLS